jgi:hypothetical protein
MHDELIKDAEVKDAESALSLMEAREPMIQLLASGPMSCSAFHACKVLFRVARENREFYFNACRIYDEREGDTDACVAQRVQAALNGEKEEEEVGEAEEEQEEDGEEEHDTEDEGEGEEEEGPPAIKREVLAMADNVTAAAYQCAGAAYAAASSAAPLVPAVAHPSTAAVADAVADACATPVDAAAGRQLRSRWHGGASADEPSSKRLHTARTQQARSRTQPARGGEGKLGWNDFQRSIRGRGMNPEETKAAYHQQLGKSAALPGSPPDPMGEGSDDEAERETELSRDGDSPAASEDGESISGMDEDEESAGMGLDLGLDEILDTFQSEQLGLESQQMTM